MVARLSEEQRLLLMKTQQKPIEIVDSQTNQHYVLMNKTQYDQLLPLMEPTRYSAEEKQQQLAAMGKRAGWDDPVFDVYDALAQEQP
ncbi:MAG: hypothetical protein QM703_17625 [Gemmatales bacterium]